MNDQPDIEVLRDLWLVRFGMEWVEGLELREPFWSRTSRALQRRGQLLVFVLDGLPIKARLREKQTAPQGASTKE
jgi:hypothetical protein